MRVRTLVPIVLLAGSCLLNLACQNKHQSSGSVNRPFVEKTQEKEELNYGPQGCPAHIGGTWMIGATAQSLSFDTSNGQLKIRVPMGDYSFVDGVPHSLPGGKYLGICTDNKLVFTLTQLTGKGAVFAKTKWVITTTDQDHGQAELSVAHRNEKTGRISAPKTERFDLSRSNTSAELQSEL
jgi:hypothetical protein